MRLRGPVCFLLTLGLLTSSAVYAVEYYRYTDERGITVINRQGVPPHLIGKGYEVLSEQGRVTRVVPRAPTVEEYKAKQVKKAQAKADMQLLRLYPRLEDIDHARERKLAEIDGQINIARNNLLVVDSLKANLQGQAALQERSGQVVAELLLQRIAETAADQQRLQRQISLYLQRKQDLNTDFERDRVRLTDLLKQK
ncbi:MAG TPA: DUF4124 domain-containing protein [Thiopseudomonas sp.]|nr:DUF4124 domain-containing protein [Thiopseudomonas sp.]